MDLADLAPAGASLQQPVTGTGGQTVAQFTRPVVQHPDSIWSPRGSEIAPASRPLPQPGHPIEDEPVDDAERDSQDTVQRAASFTDTAAQVRAALRPGAIL